ncbi:LOW QUALITY PROTEIN: hypothetical protein MSG28_015135 [Choristoneura fumiferana]|uniref:Uncharacterized protein n=1 Tax=Choristoneura fumiferana TaxID=7141 RepID=A0ACC0KYX5_CHOFU|nr:LOW QUALITY PROTEIN: hypothetical protein MSG28_015135 [Choristoneura fumiferana]
MLARRWQHHCLEVREAAQALLLAELARCGGQQETQRWRQQKEFGRFNLSASNNLARLTALALTHLLLAPPCPRLPAHTPLRRAAVDLLGRGFTVWEPYLDKFGYHVLQKSRAVVLRGIELLIGRIHNLVAELLVENPGHGTNCIDSQYPGHDQNFNSEISMRWKRGGLKYFKASNEITELLVEVMDIILHCVDQSHLKSKGLSDVFPAICRYNQVSHCPATRRIAVGSHTGQLAMYELRAGRCQSLAAHSGPVTACAFSPDGRYLVSYATADNRLTAPMADVARLNPARLARLVWTNSRTVTLMLADGSETRFNV